MTTLILDNSIPAALLALLALSLNLQYGLTGLFNFGQGFFYAVGGYCVGVVYYHHWPPWIGVASAPIFGALAGILLAIPSKRLSDDFWALMTLGVAALFVAVASNVQSFAGGTLGSFGITIVAPSRLLPILCALIVVTFLAFERIRRSQFGRIIRTAREDPVLVAALGRDVFRFRCVVLAIGGMTAAVAGAALAFWLSIVAPTVFTLDQTVLIWTAVIIGGRGNNLGVIVGAIGVQSLLTYTPYLPGFGSVFSPTNAPLVQLVIEGGFLVLFLFVRKEGLIPEWRVRFAPRP